MEKITKTLLESLNSEPTKEIKIVKESEENVHKVKDCLDDVDMITALEGDTLMIEDEFDWEKVKEEGVNYAIIRFTAFSGFHENGNLNIDDKFYENVAECTRLGIPYGIYCYTKAESEAEAKAEANALINRLKGTGIDKNLDLPIYYDIEMKKHLNQ